MTRIVFVQADGSEQTVSAEDGMSLMQNAVSNNISGIVGECAGSMMCATCHVYVDDSRVSVKSEDESEMLEMVASDLRDSSRLSCQIPIDSSLDGMIVQVPGKQI